MQERAVRVTLAGLGVGLIGYGAVRLLQAQTPAQLAAIAKWLIAVLIVHDAIVSPLVIAVGLLLAAVVRQRWLGFVQLGVAVFALVSSVAVFLIWRQGKSSAASLALLQRNYLANLLILASLISLATIGLAAASGYRNAARSKRRKSRPPRLH